MLTALTAVRAPIHFIGSGLSKVAFASRFIEFTSLFVAILFLPLDLQSTLHGQEVEIAREFARQREAIAVSGLEWHWIEESGQCQSIEDMKEGRFVDQPQVFDVEWICNDSRMNWRRTARASDAEPQTDKASGTVYQENSSSALLATPNSELYYLPDSLTSAFAGHVRGEMQGSMSTSMINNPIHGMLCNFGFIDGVFNVAINNVEVLNEGEGTVETKITLGSGYSRVIVFETLSYLPMKSSVVRDGEVVSSAEVLETKSVTHNGNNVLFPVKIRSGSRQGTMWHSFSIDTTSLEFVPADFTQMTIDFPHGVETRLVDQATGLAVPINKDSLNVSQLDDTVTDLQQKAAQRKARYERQHSAASSAEKEGTLGWWLVAVNIAAVTVILLVYLSRRRKTVQ